MSDPIDELSNFAPGVPMSPIPAAEVRRRGERLRRRRTALVVGGAVAAVVLIAVPVAVVANGDDGGKPQPAAPVITEDDLLTPDELPVRDRLTPWEPMAAEGQVLSCAPQLPASLDETLGYRQDFRADIADAPAEEIPSSVIRSQVLQFDSATEARQAYDQAQGWNFGCPGGDNLARKGVSVSTFELKAGQGEWRLHEFYAPDICTECGAIRFERMGIAQWEDRMILVSLAEVGGPLEPEGLDDSMNELFQAAVTKADGEIIGAGGEGEDTGEPEPEPSDETTEPDPVGGGITIPDDFPLAAGWPVHEQPEGDGTGLEGPSAELAPYEYSACGDVLELRPASSLRASWSNVEDYRTRELSIFDTADEAVAFMSEATAFYESCPEEQTDDRYTSIRRVLETQVGGQAYAVAHTFEFDGAPAVGMEVLHLVRVGHSVLIDTTYNEGGAGPDQDAEIQGQIQRQTTDTAEIVASMCLFTEDGC